VVFISDETISRLIKEDVPYIDLTTMLLGIGRKQGRIVFSTREDGVLAGSEEVLRIFQKLDIKAVRCFGKRSRHEKRGDHYCRRREG